MATDTVRKYYHRYHHFLTRKEYILSLIGSLLFFLISLIANYFSSQYAFIRKGNPVPDLLLDNLPVVNMDVAFVVGTWIAVAIIVIVILRYPHRIPFVLKSMALFIITRSLFVTLTHIGPSPFSTLTAPSEIGRAFTSGADLFFSGHTGMPYLFALMYWHNKHLRIVFFVMSVLAAVGVILGHIHYSIDVASAYFITYGVFVMATKIFKKEYGEFRTDVELRGNH